MPVLAKTLPGKTLTAYSRDTPERSRPEHWEVVPVGGSSFTIRAPHSNRSPTRAALASVHGLARTSALTLHTHWTLCLDSCPRVCAAGAAELPGRRDRPAGSRRRNMETAQNAFPRPGSTLNLVLVECFPFPVLFFLHCERVTCLEKKAWVS